MSRRAMPREEMLCAVAGEVFPLRLTWKQRLQHKRAKISERPRPLELFRSLQEDLFIHKRQRTARTQLLKISAPSAHLAVLFLVN